MIPMTLLDVAKFTRGMFLGERDAEKIKIENVATDTRKSMKDCLFIALKGENFNAHKFLKQAEEQGAVACLVDEECETSLPKIMVPDTLKSMGKLAASIRSKLDFPFIGITGSSGKTTVKEMVSSILMQKGKVLATRGNFNNAVGVPLTLFRLTEEDQYAVIEMGASKVGDIDEVAQLVKPDVAMITNVSAAHLQGLGSIEGVANVKGEILDYLTKTGTAVLEQDSPWLARWMTQLTPEQKLVTFSISNPGADFYGTEIVLNDEGQAKFIAHSPEGEVAISLSIPGSHNVNNALAAMAAAIAAGATLDDCQRGLAEVGAVQGRMQIRTGTHGCRIIDDSYNANPASLFAAMDLLKEFTGKRILVMGDMAELGDKAESAHTNAGQQALAMGLDGIYAVGELTELTVNRFGKGAKHFNSKDELLKTLMADMSSEDASQWNLLVKGSRSSAMDEIVTRLQGTAQQKQKEGVR